MDLYTEISLIIPLTPHPLLFGTASLHGINPNLSYPTYKSLHSTAYYTSTPVHALGAASVWSLLPPVSTVTSNLTSFYTATRLASSKILFRPVNSLLKILLKALCSLPDKMRKCLHDTKVLSWSDPYHPVLFYLLPLILALDTSGILLTLSKTNRNFLMPNASCLYMFHSLNLLSSPWSSLPGKFLGGFQISGPALQPVWSLLWLFQASPRPSTPAPYIDFH